MLLRINRYEELDVRKLMDVYAESNFENTDYFFTVFRRLTGQTPLAYRSETQGRKL